MEGGREGGREGRREERKEGGTKETGATWGLVVGYRWVGWGGGVMGYWSHLGIWLSGMGTLFPRFTNMSLELMEWHACGVQY